MEKKTQNWRQTLRQETGASLIAALLFFALCGMGASILLALASSSRFPALANRPEEQKRLAVESAAAFLRDELSAPENTVKIKEETLTDEEGNLLTHHISYYYAGKDGTENEADWTLFSARASILDSLIRETYRSMDSAATQHNPLPPDPKYFVLSVETDGNLEQNPIPQLRTEVRLSMASDFSITAIVSDLQTASDQEENRWERRLTLPAQVDTVTETVVEEDSSEENPDAEEPDPFSEESEEAALQIRTTVLTTIHWESGIIEKELLLP